MTLNFGLIRDKNKQCRSEYCEGLKPHTHSENQLTNKSLDRLLRPQLSDEFIARENDFKRIYSSTYQRCRQITSKAHEYRNRFKLGRPINIGQKVFLENQTADLNRSQKLKQLRVGPFTVTKQIINTTYEIQEDANPDKIKVTHRNHLIEYFPKEERLSPLFTDYTCSITKDSDFYKHLVQSQINDYNSNQQKCSLDVMPFIISPLQENINIQETSKNHTTLLPNADSGLQSPSTPTSDNHNYQNLTISPLPPLQTPILPMTPMPIRVPTILRTTPHFHEAEQSTSSSPKKKYNVADLTSKVKAKYKRSHPDSSLRDSERKGYKDLILDYNSPIKLQPTK